MIPRVEALVLSAAQGSAARRLLLLLPLCLPALLAAIMFVRIVTQRLAVRAAHSSTKGACCGTHAAQAKPTKTTVLLVLILSQRVMLHVHA